MRKLSTLILLLVPILLASSVVAQVDEKLAKKRQLLDTIELGTITVLGERLDERQALALRVVKMGLENRRRSSAEHANDIVCWFHAPIGTVLPHLYCGANWALDASRRAGIAKMSESFGGLRVGMAPEAVSKAPRMEDYLYISSQPVNPGFVEDLMASLGPATLNREIITKYVQGGEMPEDVPSEKELNQFLMAYADVRSIRADYEPHLRELSREEREAVQLEADEQMVQAIEEAGLSVESYNAISEMSEEYESLRQYLAARITR